MECKEIKELLYEFVTNRLGKEDFQLVEEHLKTCQGCQKESKELKDTLLLLNGWKIPELSPDFRAKVMNAIEGRVERKQVPLLDRILNKIFRPYYLKLPLQGLAVAAMIFLAFTIYRGFVPEPDRGERGFQITTKIIEAKSPIIVETENFEKSFSKLKDIIQTYHGSLVRRRPVEGGMEVTFKVEKEQEENILKELDELGKVQKREEGFKDSDGNIVIVLRRK